MFLAYFLLHLLIYLMIRVEFLVWNWSSLKNLSHSDLFLAFLHGLRFDLAALALPVGVFLLGWVWVNKYKSFKALWFILFGVLQFCLFLLNLGDSELFNFTARRFTKSSFFVFSDAHVSNIILPYLGIVFLIIIFLFLYSWINYKVFRLKQENITLKHKALLSFFIIVMTVVFSRGGFQVKPITFVDAKIFDQSYANNLVLNSTFTLFKSFGKPAVERIHFFDNDKMLSLLNPQNLPSSLASPEKKQRPLNVVLVILESFSKEYFELKNPQATPFLNSIRKNAVEFKNAYANGRRSIEGIAALLSGIPALMEEPFINSEFSSNQIIGLGTLLTQKSYHTSFFHGAQNGSMHFDQFTKSVGIQNYFGKDQYPNSSDDDGTWGVYDEPFLNWACQKMSEFQQPFFSTIFTLSSHQPFSLPEKYKSKFADERLPILKSVQYTDFAIEQFMKCAEKEKWFENTLFVFTADHTGPELVGNSSFKSRFEVPFIFYQPHLEILKQLDSNLPAQHIDFLPTLLETLGIPLKNKNYLARSLWEKGPKVIALYADNKYELVGDVYDKEDQLKAIQQYFSEGLFDNRLYYPVK